MFTGNKILKVVYAIFMAAVLAAVIAFMVVHIKAGLCTQNAKLVLAAYVLLTLWASYRLFTLLRDIVRK